MFPQNIQNTLVKENSENSGLKNIYKDATVPRMFFQAGNRKSLEDTDV